MRLAASRADWTAGSSRAISTAMIAMTTSSSIKVKPRLRFITDLLQDKPRLTARFDLLKQNPRLAVSMPHLLSESLLVCHGVARAAMSVAKTSPRPANRCSGVRTGRRARTGQVLNARDSEAAIEINDAGAGRSPIPP